MHSIWVLWVSGLQECKSNEFFFEIGRAGNNFQLGPEASEFLDHHGGGSHPLRFLTTCDNGVF